MMVVELLGGPKDGETWVFEGKGDITVRRVTLWTGTYTVTPGSDPPVATWTPAAEGNW